MNVTLIDLAYRSPLFKAPLWMPVMTPSLAACLRREGHAVDLIELGTLTTPHTAGSISDRLAAAIRSNRPELVFFDTQSPAWPDLLTLSAVARNALPNALLLTGGRHATLCPEETLNHAPALDGVLIGEAENTLCAIARGTPLAGLPATAGRQDGAVRLTEGEAPVLQLDDLPLPAWDLLDMIYYTRRTPRVIPCIPLKTATLESSRGCPGHCTFCTEGRLHSKVHRFHSPAYLHEAIRRLIRDYGIEGLYFSDESFLAQPGRVHELCDMLIRTGLNRQIRWTAQVRADTVTPGRLAAMKQAGCVQLEFGIETGSQRLLDELEKNTTVEQNLEALRWTREAGIRSMAYVMCGLPGETRDDQFQTGQFLARARPDIVRLNIFQLLPGSPIARALIAQGRVPADFWRETGIATPAGARPVNLTAMPLDEFRTGAQRLYLRHVLPRFTRDYLACGHLWHIPQDMDLRMFLPFLLRRLRR